MSLLHQLKIKVSICCRRMGLEPSSSMLWAFAFILQGEKLHCLSRMHYEVEFIHGHKTSWSFHLLEDAIKKFPIVLLVKKKKKVVLAWVPSILIPFIHLFWANNFKIHFLTLRNAHIPKRKFIPHGDVETGSWIRWGWGVRRFSWQQDNKTYGQLLST